MIIILKTANFSANNIGHIDVPEVSISEFTKAAILASGNESLTNSQKLAIDDFFTEIGALDDTGVFTKLNKLYVPVIGGTVAKALLNYKNNNVDAVLDAAGWEYDKGIKGNGNDTSTLATVDSNYNLDLTNASFIIREKALSQVNYSGVTYNVFISNDGGQYRALQRIGMGSGQFEAKAVDSNDRPKSLYTQKYDQSKNGHAVVTSFSGQNAFYYDIDGKHDVTTNFISTSSSVELRMFSPYLASPISKAITPITSFIALGTALSESEATLLYNSIEKMMIAFD